MAILSRAVGRGVTNDDKNEVRLVQQLLNANRKPPLAYVDESGLVSADTILAIEEFQKRVVGMNKPDGRIDPGGKTLRLLSEGIGGPQVSPVDGPGAGYFSHPDAVKVALHYGPHAVAMTATAEKLLKSILAACGMTAGTLNSTLRTYHDQARITVTQTYKNNPDTVKLWYGETVLKACKEHLDDVDGFAKWWKEYDAKRGKVSSKHLSNHAMDVVPGGDRTKFVKKVKELILVAGSGVSRIIPKGELNEPVDHVEFSFEIT